ncbi:MULTISPECIES: homing endonuclease associated repeat-containing protein [Bacillus]|uniref:Uncharacterized protein n=1 Tax=Bacillus glycinifermentans TaxID=1664069 RepID=A0A0T6BN29_9BACI|nr:MULTISPECIES: hypothetical protein [Bacillus]KRT93063.1 hypothetical protein AB447_203785 [Bacillus glycinifermentans]MEC0341956.1 hypothetical protein [Bacillus sonorensis]MEC0457359.1 hypothetical protein [Bacillus sonorensis]MEC0487874.1 hypothetical protein [Bacillus glycinifermentans]MEC0530675.1 hypothetical protein [Bacillus sonorensis]
MNIKKQRYTDSELVSIIQEEAKKLGRPPTAKEMKLAPTLIYRFGSYKKALEAAGVTEKYADDDLLDLIKDKYRELGRPPKKNEVPKSRLIVKRFGSFKGALKLAGINGCSKKTMYSNDDLLEILQASAKELGRPPKQDEIKQTGTIIKRFGNFNNALKAAGIEVVHKRGYTDDELLDLLQTFVKEHGRTPKKREFSQWQTIINRFGSIDKALEAASMRIRT